MFFLKSFLSYIYVNEPLNKAHPSFKMTFGFQHRRGVSLYHIAEIKPAGNWVFETCRWCSVACAVFSHQFEESVNCLQNLLRLVHCTMQHMLSFCLFLVFAVICIFLCVDEYVKWWPLSLKQSTETLSQSINFRTEKSLSGIVHIRWILFALWRPLICFLFVC